LKRATTTPPPAHLSERARALWRVLVPRRARSPERLALLTVALEALDRAEQARAQLEQEGLTRTTETTGTVHLHPASRIEKDARSLFARVWEQLGLAWDANLDGRR
jgi:P27 family predicted phage terminase small subunit